MEAVKTSEPLKFTYGDLTVLVKPIASSQDRAEVILAKPGIEKFRAALSVMVQGWAGFVRDGQPVPWSLDEIINVPDLPGKGNFFIRLGAFIADKTDVIVGYGKDSKNDSAPSSTGPSAPVEPSTAGAKIA